MKSMFFINEKGYIRYKGSFITTQEGRVVFVGGPGSGGGSTTGKASAVATMVSTIPEANLSKMSIGESLPESTYGHAKIGIALYRPQSRTLVVGSASDLHERLHAQFSGDQPYDDFVKVRIPSVSFVPITIFANRTSAQNETHLWEKVFDTMQVLKDVGYDLNTKVSVVFGGGKPNARFTLSEGTKQYKSIILALKPLGVEKKGSFITTEEGRVVFVGGPGQGGGGSGGGTTVTGGNVAALLTSMDDGEFYANFNAVQHAHSNATNEYRDFEDIVAKLRSGSIDADQAYNRLSIYSVAVRKVAILEGAERLMQTRRNRFDSLTSIYQQMYAEASRRLRQ